MKVKFVDYEVEHKGYWNYGYKYWLTKQNVNNNGKVESIIIITTNDLKDINKKLEELSSQSIKVEFEENESFKQYKSKLKI
ncbi:hypothetical protein [Neobacillus sp. D3-1R]|uniref:hypothetical protein n=1 Tax=Neobacillus sp. D3-1R TaxID=3445778 RepID=UPI003F9EF870